MSRNQQKTLSSIIQYAIAMAQELEEIIGDATDAGCPNPMPGTQAIVNEWEAFYKANNLINEITPE
jgi:hypothetical protein